MVQWICDRCGDVGTGEDVWPMMLNHKIWRDKGEVLADLCKRCQKAVADEMHKKATS